MQRKLPATCIWLPASACLISHATAGDISLLQCHFIVGLQAFIKNDNSHTYQYSSLKG